MTTRLVTFCDNCGAQMKPTEPYKGCYEHDEDRCIDCWSMCEDIGHSLLAKVVPSNPDVARGIGTIIIVKEVR